jgi:CheY-like chemotaxis protein
MSARTSSALALKAPGRAGQKSKRHAAKHVSLETLAPHTDWSAMSVSDHFVQLYEEDTALLNAVSCFMRTGLQAREAAVVIATRSHRHQLAARLRTQGVDLTLVREQGQYIALDAAKTLSLIMRCGGLDTQCFGDVIGGIMAPTDSRYARVRVFGEMVALLWAEGKGAAALRLEELWNDLATRHVFSLFCAYPMRVFPRAGDGKQFRQMCAAHSYVIPTESYTALTSADERLRTIVHLQQQAHALASEIAARQQAEQALQQACSELEQRVLERTAALNAANAALHEAIAAREHAQVTLNGYLSPTIQPPLLARPVSAPAVGVLTILIVDDEPGIVRALTSLLQRDGHTVEAAANGRLALTKCQERDYDMILCDLRMPELDGPGFYRELQRRGSSLCQRVLFLTGDTLDLETQAFLERVALPHLTKPFTAAMIRKALLANMANLGLGESPLHASGLAPSV